MSPLYQLKGITKQYGARTVLAVSQLVIDEGETVALIGPSGAGKSTLLRLLCLLEAPTTGAICYAGRPVMATQRHTVPHEITLVFQRPLLLDTTVRANVAYGLRLRKRRDDQRIEALLDLLGLRELAHARATTLSGGEMQRVALARALLIQPRVLLLDEPTANLDPYNVALMEQAIKALQNEGSTIIVATHNLHQARRLTQRAIFLWQGQLIEEGPTEQMLHEARDARTRAFVSGELIY
ncbi:MAG: phosphate ABC transporter ATP-binding protein [Chloroflexi bacterium]|nr:MAG: phosphate ABC transporter ATP-binding protein [Chloroflexota bacterium]